MRSVLPTSPSASRFTRYFSGRRSGASSSSQRGCARFTARTRPAATASASSGGTSAFSPAQSVCTPSSAVRSAASVTGNVSRPIMSGRSKR